MTNYQPAGLDKHVQGSVHQHLNNNDEDVEGPSHGGLYKHLLAA